MAENDAISTIIGAYDVSGGLITVLAESTATVETGAQPAEVRAGVTGEQLSQRLPLCRPETPLHRKEKEASYYEFNPVYIKEVWWDFIGQKQIPLFFQYSAPFVILS